MQSVSVWMIVNDCSVDTSKYSLKSAFSSNTLECDNNSRSHIFIEDMACNESVVASRYILSILRLPRRGRGRESPRC